MELPKIGENYFQERHGVMRVASLLNECRLIWRETPNADVGIDGQIEFVDTEGRATGTTVAAQIKSGSSYFHDGDYCWRYYPADKHRGYWEHYPIPVLIMLHKPDTNEVFWQDARRVLRSDQNREKYIPVPKANKLSSRERVALFQSCGTPEVRLLEPVGVLRMLTLSINSNASFPISYLDIFLEGLTDIGRKTFFSMGMCFDLAESRVANGMPVGIGATEFEFVDRYVQILVAQKIALIDYSDFMIDLLDRQMVSTFLVPLTSRGRAVRDLCRQLGTVGDPTEITEASVGLIDPWELRKRRRANAGVAAKIFAHFDPLKKNP